MEKQNKTKHVNSRSLTSFSYLKDVHRILHPNVDFKKRGGVLFTRECKLMEQWKEENYVILPISGL